MGPFIEGGGMPAIYQEREDASRSLREGGCRRTSREGGCQSFVERGRTLPYIERGRTLAIH